MAAASDYWELQSGCGIGGVAIRNAKIREHGVVTGDWKSSWVVLK